jgi:hypothetical protein
VVVEPISDPLVWLGEYPSTGQVLFRVGRAQNEFVADWPGFCRLRADRTTGASEMTWAHGVDPLLIEKHNGIARALLRHLAGKLTLHAAAIAFGDRAVACFGASEVGKSTTIASLSLRPGAELLADDTLAVEFVKGGVQILPSEPLSWLRPEAHAFLGHGEVTLKSPVAPPRAATEAAGLVALARLTFDETAPRPLLRRLRGHAALAALVPSVVRFILDEHAAHLNESEQLAALIRAVPIYELTRRRDVSSLSESADLLVSLLRGHVP